MQDRILAIKDSRNELEGKIKDSKNELPVEGKTKVSRNDLEKTYKQTLELSLTSFKNEILLAIQELKATKKDDFVKEHNE